jgi:hypothetical protein
MTLNVFPATARVNGVEFKNCRVRTNNSADERLQVWVNSNGQPMLVLDDLVVETPAPYNMWAPMQERTGVYITTTSRVDVAQAMGCGCGSPLRNIPSWRAFDEPVMVTA